MRLQQYVNQELADVQVGFRQGRGPDQTANICWIIEKVKELKKIDFCFIDYSCDCIDQINRDENTRPPYLSLEKPVYRSRSNNENHTRLWFFQYSYIYVKVGPYRRLSVEELTLSNCGTGENS